MFADWPSAREHLRDHLLTAPESEAWAVVAPGYLLLLDPADGDARWRYWEQVETSGGAAAQPLYDLYREAASADALDARLVRWVRVQGRVTVAVGTSGILMLVEDGIVRTAFLPGQGDPEATRQARASEDGRGLVRERGMRSGRPGTGGAGNREEAIRQRREAGWTPEQRLYYRVFRPCVQFVKRCHHRHRDLYGRLLRQDYALLKECLPARSRLKLDDWLDLRRRCGRG